MGTHYLNMDYGNKTDCRKASPMQLIYIDNHLVGFALQLAAPLGFGELCPSHWIVEKLKN